MALDRSTLEVLANVAVDIDDPDALADTIGDQADSSLVIVTGGGRSYVGPGGAVDDDFTLENATALESAFALLGGDDDREGPMQFGGWTLADGRWSIIGQPRDSANSASQNHDIVSGGAGNPGSLVGYLQQDQFQQFSYSSGDYVPIDTNVPGSASGENAIRVGGQTYESAGTLAASESGFQALVLDGDLGLVANETYRTNTSSGVDVAGVSGLIQLLGTQVPGASTGPESEVVPDLPETLVILQSIGAPAGEDVHWVDDTDPVSNDAASWGETLAGMVGRLAGPAAHDQLAQMVAPGMTQPRPARGGGYTLIASTQLSDPYAQAWSQSQSAMGLSKARVVGTLSRNRDSQWIVSTPSSEDGFDPGSIAQLAYQEPTPFPLDSGPYLKASRWIAAQLGFTAPDVRSGYYEDFDGNWASLRNQMMLLDPPKGIGVSAAQFKQLQDQLRVEMDAVADVQGLIGDLQGEFGTSTGMAANVSLQSIASTIVGDIERLNQLNHPQASVDPLSVMGSVLWLAQGLAGVAGQEELEAPIGVMAGAFGLVDSISSQDSGGGRSTAPITEEAKQLGASLYARYQQLSTTLGLVGNLLVSDWGKLQDASRRANGVWETNTSVSTFRKQGLELAANATFYDSLVPVAYGQYVLSDHGTTLNPTPWKDPWSYRCMRSVDDLITPFADTQSNAAAWLSGPTAIGAGIGGDTAVSTRILSTEIGWGGGPSRFVEDLPQVLPGNVSKILFAAPDIDGSDDVSGVGLDQVRFFGNPALQRWGIDCQDG